MIFTLGLLLLRWVCCIDDLYVGVGCICSGVVPLGWVRLVGMPVGFWVFGGLI